MSSIISAQNISFQVPYGEMVLKDISFDLSPGEFMGLLGVNGAGKTALINMLLGNLNISRGKLQVLGETPYSLKRNRKQDIGYISQNIMLHKGLVVEDFLEMFSGFYARYNKETQKYLCERMELDPKKKIGALSLGQEKKVQVVANLSAGIRLLIVDEITAVFDEKSRQVFFEILKEFQQNQSLSIFLATNIAKDLKQYADSVVFLKDGVSRIHNRIDVEEIFEIQGKVA